jgi:hypothetical protein
MGTGGRGVDGGPLIWEHGLFFVSEGGCGLFANGDGVLGWCKLMEASRGTGATAQVDRTAVADGGRQGNPIWVGGASQAMAWKARVGEEEDGDRAGSIRVTSSVFSTIG